MKGKIIGYSILGIVSIGAVAASIYGIKWAIAPAQGALEKRQEVQSGDYRKYSYEHFYDLYVAIQRKRGSLRSQCDYLDHAGNKDEVYQRIAALRAQLISNIEQYNQDSRKMETMGQFKSTDLPDVIPKNVPHCNTN